MDLQGLATQGAAGAALGAATAAVVKFLKNLLKIFALIQFGLLTALELSGIITVNWDKLWETITSAGGLVGDAAESALDALMQMGSFGSGFAIGFATVWFRTEKN
ncbi:MAG: hypothetical protein CND66_04760 [Marine Group II euryarchaeote MED-G37]|nr:MAG: hypothetical protein CND66_04760 [Marine Group II euryarchaeote MED-G37]|tara:strand:+ start:90 stop:404 length:315 start_codon:yes stop_codon:yes gene_type:complete